ncbi:MAG: hypothetical protein ACTSUB_09670 [Candidatus Thorarchaeota archaeon]
MMMIGMREFQEIEEECEKDIEQALSIRRLTIRERDQIIKRMVLKHPESGCEGNAEMNHEIETQEIVLPNFPEIKSSLELDIALSHFPELRFMKCFQENFYRARIYCILFERISCEEVDSIDDDYTKFLTEFNGISLKSIHQWLEGKRKPQLIVTLEGLIVRRQYEISKGNPVNVIIESMNDIDLLVEKHPQNKSLTKYNDLYIQCQSFFEIKDNWIKTQEELAKMYGVSHSTIGYWRSGREPRLISELRKLEEQDILSKWATSLFKDDTRSFSLEYNECDFPREDKAKQEFTIQEIQFPELKEILIQNDVELWNDSIKASFASCLFRSITSSEACTFRISIPNGFDTVIKKYLDSIRLALQEQMGYDSKIQQIRIGVIQSNLFIWLRKRDSDNMIHVWGNQFFYFRERKDLLNLLVRTRDDLGLDCSISDAIVHLNRLLEQVIESNSSANIPNCHEIRPMTSRLCGDTLCFLLNITGVSVSDLQGRISKISAPNGRGGIHNPRFLEGREFEIERAKLIAAIMSDGSVKKNGRVAYCEGSSDRFDIVVNGLQSWGDIEVIRYRTEGNNYIEGHLPSPFGIALMFWGFKPGDKTIRNCGLPIIDVHSSWDVRIAYLRGLIPEDGCFYRNRFLWGRSVALHAGNKTRMYEFHNIMTKHEIEFIKKNKTHYHYDTKCYSLTCSSLEELRNSHDSEISSFATEILSKIYDHPNNLIHDEIKIVNSLGIEVILVPKKISFYEKTGKVTVHWLASTIDIEHTTRWALLCPPDDIQKKSLVRKWLPNHSELVEQIQQMNGIYCCEGIDWWKTRT